MICFIINFTLNMACNSNVFFLQDWSTEAVGADYRLRAVLLESEGSLMEHGATRSAI